MKVLAVSLLCGPTYRLVACQRGREGDAAWPTAKHGDADSRYAPRPPPPPRGGGGDIRPALHRPARYGPSPLLSSATASCSRIAA
jgi:hypothetical protein